MECKFPRLIIRCFRVGDPDLLSLHLDDTLHLPIKLSLIEGSTTYNDLDAIRHCDMIFKSYKIDLDFISLNQDSKITPKKSCTWSLMATPALKSLEKVQRMDKEGSSNNA